jgi:peptidoglycan hydrolase-like protein with peptidoglycan-binding domain
MYTVASMNKINPDIIELQKVLVADGVLGQNSQTGVYDAVTKAAVEAFQKKHGIKPAPQYTYGYFGPITRNYLNTK